MNKSQATDSAKVLIVGVNWLGDCVMAMPALQSYHRRHPERRLVMLTRPPLAPLWHLHPALSEVRVCSGGVLEQFRMSRLLRHEKIDTAFIWPRSFRAALAPWLAGIPGRRGLRGHTRDWMLTEIVAPPGDSRRHQAHEYLQLMGDASAAIPPPALLVPSALKQKWLSHLRNAGAETWTALLPGAAFGPAKRWPATHFAETGRRLQCALNTGIVVLGARAEAALCQNVAEQIGGGVLNMAGRTSLTDLAAILSCCRLAIANDSGGMHLAAATHTPLVAIFGITDPEKTGPLGARAAVLQNSDYRARDFKRHIRRAGAALAAITPEQVVAAALRLNAT